MKSLWTADRSAWRRRVEQVAIQLVAHGFRVVSLAPVLGAPMIAIMMAGTITNTAESMAPYFEWFLPEEIREEYSGELMGFGLPIAMKYLYMGFWIFLLLTIFEHVTGWRISK